MRKFKKIIALGLAAMTAVSAMSMSALAKNSFQTIQTNIIERDSTNVPFVLSGTSDDNRTANAAIQMPVTQFDSVTMEIQPVAGGNTVFEGALSADITDIPGILLGNGYYLEIVAVSGDRKNVYETDFVMYQKYIGRSNILSDELRVFTGDILTATASVTTPDVDIQLALDSKYDEYLGSTQDNEVELSTNAGTEISVTQGPCNVICDGDFVSFDSNNLPLSYNGSTYFAKSDLEKMLGVEISYDAAKNIITVDKSKNTVYDDENKNISHTFIDSKKTYSATLLNNTEFYSKGKKFVPNDIQSNDLYAIMYNNTLYLPIRAINGIANKELIWDGQCERIFIRDYIDNVHINPGEQYSENTEKLCSKITEECISLIDDIWDREKFKNTNKFVVKDVDASLKSIAEIKENLSYVINDDTKNLPQLLLKTSNKIKSDAALINGALINFEKLIKEKQEFSKAEVDELYQYKYQIRYYVYDLLDNATFCCDLMGDDHSFND